MSLRPKSNTRNDKARHSIDNNSEKSSQKNIQEDSTDEKLNMQNDFQNLNQNYSKGDFIINIRNQEQGLNNKATTSDTKTKGNNTKKRKDNCRKQIFFIVMIFLKLFFKEKYDLDFSSFNCDEVLGTSIRYMKLPLGLKIYQLFGYYKKFETIILKALKSSIPKHEKMVLLYFLTRTYEELYNRYISNDIDFPVFHKGTLRICQFMTLKKKIAEKKEEGSDKNEIDEFVEMSTNLIKDIKSGRFERKIIKKKKNKKTKTFIPIVIKELEDMRKYFKADIHYEDIQTDGLELEENEV